MLFCKGRSDTRFSGFSGFSCGFGHHFRAFRRAAAQKQTSGAKHSSPSFFLRWPEGLKFRALVKRGALASRFAFPCCAEAMVPFLCMLMTRKLGLADSQRLLFFCFCFYLRSEGFSENWESVRDAQTLGGECFAPHLHFARQSEVPQVLLMF